MNKKSIWFILVLGVFFLELFHAPAISAQSQAAAASIEGIVYDPTAAVVPNVTVTAVNNGTGLTRTVKTDQHGRYLVSLLPPGEYTLTMTSGGFAEVKFQAVVLRVGDAVTIDGHLQPAGIREEAVVVAADTIPAVEPTRTQPGTVIERSVINALPLNGRNWTELVLLTPGVTTANDFGDVSFAGVDRVFNNIQVDGADNNNAYFGEIRGRTRAPFQFSQETIQEFRVANNNFSAEFGHAAGGIVNAITRSGTNEWHGGGFYYVRDSIFNANGWFNNANSIARPPERRQQFGGNIGGPLLKDKLFFFLNYDQQVRSEPVSVILGTRLENDIKALPSGDRALAEQIFRPLVRAVPRNFDQINFFPRLDWNINQNHTLILTHNWQQFDSLNGVFSTPTTTTNSTGNAKNFSNTYTNVITLNSVFTPRLINEFRFNFTFDDSGDFANAPNVPQIGISGFNLGGRTFLQSRPGLEFPGRFTDEKRQQLIDNFSIVLSAHTIKLGLDINRIVDRNFRADSINGSYSFSTLTDFLRGNVSSYTQRFYTQSPLVRQVTFNYGFYAQDTYRVTPKLTVYYGLRYELQTLPKTLATNPLATLPRYFGNVNLTATLHEDKNNVAPRFGFAFSPFNDGKTVVRGGYGIFHGITPNLAINDALTSNNAYSFSVFVSGDQVPPFPPISAIAANPLHLDALPFQALSQPPGAFNFADPTSDLTVFAPNRVNPYTQQGNLEIEHEVFSRTSVAVSYLFTRGVHISRTRNLNINPPQAGGFGVATIRVLNSSGQVAQSVTLPRIGAAALISLRPNPNFRQILVEESDANSIYHALAVRVQRRLYKGFTVLASYTLAKNIDDIRNALGGFSDILDPFNIRLDRGLSDLDQRQRLVISSVWEIPFFKQAENQAVRHILGGWELGGIALFSSGRPVTANIAGGSVETDLNEDNVILDRAPNFGRNTFTGPGRNQIDFSLRKRVNLAEKKSLEFIFQVFNMANHPQFTGVQSNLYDSRRTGGFANRVFILTPRTDFVQPAFGLRSRDFQFGAKFSF
jgi:hypothetical protein